MSGIEATSLLLCVVFLAANLIDRAIERRHDRETRARLARGRWS